MIHHASHGSHLQVQGCNNSVGCESLGMDFDHLADRRWELRLFNRNFSWISISLLYQTPNTPPKYLPHPRGPKMSYLLYLFLFIEVAKSSPPIKPRHLRNSTCIHSIEYLGNDCRRVIINAIRPLGYAIAVLALLGVILLLTLYLVKKRRDAQSGS